MTKTLFAMTGTALLFAATLVPQQADAFNESDLNWLTSAAQCNALLDTSDRWPGETDYDAVEALRQRIEASVNKIERKAGESAEMLMSVVYENYLARYNSLVAELNVDTESEGVKEKFLESLFGCQFSFAETQ